MSISFDEAKQIIRESVNCGDYLQKSKYGMYCCPVCGSGTGPNRSGAVKVYPSGMWKCHACGKFGDVIDLITILDNKDIKEAVQALAQRAGIREDIVFGRTGGSTRKAADTVPSEEAPATDAGSPSPDGQRAQQGTGAQENGLPESGEHSTGEQRTRAPATAAEAAAAYREQCKRNLAESAEAQAYLAGRGLEWQLALVNGDTGFDPAADPISAPCGVGRKWHPVPRIIYWTSDTEYEGKSIDPHTEPKYRRMCPRDAEPGIYQRSFLYGEYGEVFVCEGPEDALSIGMAGRAAVSVQGTPKVSHFLKELEAKRTDATLILCLDNDEAGRKGRQELAEGLDRLNIPYITADICCGHKDPNEALQADRDAFTRAVNLAVHRARNDRPDSTMEYLDRMMAGEIRQFQKGKGRATGFSNLDTKMRSAYAGLYVLAAITSLGKTTLALQMADQMAARGTDVLYFSMEQSRLELVSKSLARMTAQRNMDSGITSLDIRDSTQLPGEVLEAVQHYKNTIGNRLSIIEGNFNCDTGFIRDYIRDYIRKTDTSPVVFIDYLQILQPSAEGESRRSKKDEIDLAVTELKRLSRELGLTVIVISSVNRANYATKFSFESLKESGGIEYTADVVWGLQLACLDQDIFSKEGMAPLKREAIDNAKEENPRRIKLVCLKNRYGKSKYSAYFNYYPAVDLFVPVLDFVGQQPATDTRPRSRK